MSGSLAIPNTFLGNSPDAISKLDQNFTTVAAYVNNREIITGLLASRPAAGTAGAWYFATDTGALYTDNGSAWVLVALSKTNLGETLTGLTLANNGGSIDIAAGAASSDDATIANRLLMTLGAFTKNMNAPWAVGSGNGGNNAGATLAVSTWYDVFLIERPDSGLTDVLADTTLTPALPTNYTKKRRLGSFCTDGAMAIRLFVQDGDEFLWVVPPLSFVDVNPGTAAVTKALGDVPVRVSVQARLNVTVTSTADAGGVLWVSDLSQTDAAPSATAAPLGNLVYNGAVVNPQLQSAQLLIKTNILAQLRYRLSVSSANTTIRVATLGWSDRRGRG